MTYSNFIPLVVSPTSFECTPTPGPFLALKYGAQAISGALEIAGTVLQLVDAVEQAKQQKESAKLEEDLRKLQLGLDEEDLRKDLKVIETQISAASYNLDIANAELELVLTEDRLLSETKSFLRSKFTNTELYGWLSRQLKTLLKISYNHAQDAAKMAERALQYELPTDESFISSTNWSDSKNGLLAAEMLMNDLNRMSMFHLKNDSRFQEIERKISLRKEIFKVEDGKSLVEFMDGNAFEFDLDEILYDMDYPGHYFRVIKTVGLSIQTGADVDKSLVLPRLTLIQVSNKVITQPNFAAVESLLGDDGGDEEVDPNVLRVDWRAREMATISRWDEHNGMFDTNWIWDDRYFPFEGTGAVSSWYLELPEALSEHQANLEEIMSDPEADIVMTVKYTANYDSGKFRDNVRGKVKALLEQN